MEANRGQIPHELEVYLIEGILDNLAVLTRHQFLKLKSDLLLNYKK